MNRREFIKSSSIVASLLPSLSFAKSSNRHHFIMPPKPFEYYIKEGKKKGGKILIIGGIHGNEPGGYKASDILVDTEIKKGTIAILPRSNPESIFTFKRGYNGDMNRKFANLSKKDEDFYKINSIKNFITDFKPDVILSLHDGYGYYAKHHNQWGECIVIDEAVYNNIPLLKQASFVSEYLKKEGFNIPVHNTRTSEKDSHHKEQRMSLTYYALTHHNIPAFCIEGSKQSTLKRATTIHLLAMKKFFELYNVEISPSFEYLISNVDKVIKPKPTKVIAYINNNKKIITKHEIIKLPKNSEVKFEVSNNRSAGIITKNVSVNYHSFFYRNKIDFIVKNDNISEYSFRII